jgi:hypothetical protein
VTLAFGALRRSAARLAAALALLSLAGCGQNEFYAGPSPALLPSHVRKVAIRPITKRVEAPGHNTVGWEDKLRLKIQEEMILDGRFSYVNNEADADGVLYGAITRIIFEPLSYDTNNVIQEEKLLVIVNIGFLDRVQGKVLWEENGLDNEFSYFVSTHPGGLSDDEARDELWDRFARDVVKRMVEGFGSVTGASERKISSDAPVKPADAAPAPAKEPSPADKRPVRRSAPPSPY